jgi:hypothetical protein
MKWQDFEKDVRNCASIKWSRDCNKETIIGIELDGVLRIDETKYVLLQITQNERLEKFRKDIADLNLIRNILFQKENIYSELYLITEEEVSSQMLETANASKVKTMTFKAFRNDFFNYETYKYERINRPFGSAVIPETGEKENNTFIQVDYIKAGDKTSITYTELINQLCRGKKIILKGEYGTGKSRLLQNLFVDIDKRLEKEYILAIDLRNYKGIETSEELIRRHMRTYGLKDNEDSGVKCLNHGEFLLLIDGFDEVSVQSWSENPQKLIDIRFKEFGFIREIVDTTKKGLIITGREHFFNDDNEMIKAFGFRKNDYLIIESKNEFTEEELEKFKTANNINLNIPHWFPKKPMAVRLLSNNDLTEDIEMALKINSPYFFWESFLEYIVERDAKARKDILDPDAIKRLLLAVANYTRNTSQNIGPISVEDLNKVFKEVIGYDAIDESSAYLQRLPGMGRVTSDSYDRNFTDEYFLDFLRVYKYRDEFAKGVFDSSSKMWKNILSKKGLELLSCFFMDKDIELPFIIGKLKNSVNKTMLVECISASLLSNKDKEVDFENILIDNISCSYLSFFERIIKNVSFNNSILYAFDITNSKMINTTFRQTIINKLYGVSSRNGVETIFDETCEIDEFEQISSIAKIKQIKLSPAQQYLVLIIQKVFNQRGAGRKEEVLTRGFNGIYDRKLAKKILNYLIKEKILMTHLGDEGNIYTANRKFQPRVEKILEDLTLCTDEIWLNVSELN